MQILLVEDNSDMRVLLQEMLQMGGHEVEIGRTGEEAVSVLESLSQLPEIIISDLTMPRMDGITLLNVVRENPLWANVRFVIMSANVFDDRLTPETTAMLDGVLPKPFSLDDLASILN
ncbi:MAG: response regulator [Anaerolineae bacterium]|nr:response regulator [Anaerolineae bacterium]